MKRERNKGNRLMDFLDDYIVFDLETTDSNVNYAEIIEIGAIKISNGEIIDTFSTLVKPTFPIPESATIINGITNDMVIDAPKIDDVIPEFLEFIKDQVLLGHNITTFDLNIVYDYACDIAGIEINNDFIDTLYISRNCNYDIENHKLATICDYFSIDRTGAHRALQDCYLTNACYRKMKEVGLSNKCSCGRTKSKKYSTKINAETKSLQVLNGFLMGITADNILTKDEIVSLKSWVDENIDLAGNYPFDVVLTSLNRVLEDGVITNEELESLLKLYQKFTAPVEAAEHDIITSLSGKHCCITGDFNFGSRDDVEKYIVNHGGICDKSVKKATEYVIVGAKGSANWKQGNYGGKIKKAMELKDKGQPISIITEDDFFNEIDSCK